MEFQNWRCSGGLIFYSGQGKECPNEGSQLALSLSFLLQEYRIYNGGEGGIRTHGTETAQLISSQSPSTTRALLRTEEHYTQVFRPCQGATVGPRCKSLFYCDFFNGSGPEPPPLKGVSSKDFSHDFKGLINLFFGYHQGGSESDNPGVGLLA